MIKRARRILCLIIISLMMISNVALADELALPSSSADFSAVFAKYMLMLATGHTQDKTATVLQGEGFDILVQNNYDKSVTDTVETIRNHPLMPHDIRIGGYVIDSITGEVSTVCKAE